MYYVTWHGDCIKSFFTSEMSQGFRDVRKKSTAFPAPIFTKFVNYQHNYMRISHRISSKS